VDLEHPIITQIIRTGYPKELYIQDVENDEETDKENMEE
jgi:hypothetical protein